MITIEDGIPQPYPILFTTGPGRPSQFPWAHLGPGQSFFVPGRKALPIASWTKRSGGWQFIVRTVEERGIKGVRCWRTE